MTLAHAAQRAIALGGIYDGHELPQDINKATVASATALAGQGLMAVAKDNYPHDGTTMSFVASFAEVEVDVETGQYRILDFLGVRRRGHRSFIRAHSAARCLAVPCSESAMPSARSGSMTSTMACRSQSGSTTPSRRRFWICRTQMAWGAVEMPDPETPIGARGIGEPPVGGGCSAILNAISDAVGDDVFRRAPVNADVILTALETKKPVHHNFAADV